MKPNSGRKSDLWSFSQVLGRGCNSNVKPKDGRKIFFQISVLDKVIRDNNIIYKKKWGIIPNKKEGEFLTAEAFYKKGKVLKIDNVKNTNVITIQYMAKNLN